MAYSWQLLASNWATLTAAQKEALFKGTNYEKPTPNQVKALGQVQVATFSYDESIPKVVMQAVPTPKLFVPKDIFGTAFATLDGIEAKCNTYGGDTVLYHFDSDYSDSISGRLATTSGTVNLNSSVVKFGANSLKLSGSGYLISGNDTEDFKFEDRDFTIDFWIYPTSITTRQALLSFSNVYHGVAIEAFSQLSGAVNMWASSTGVSWDICSADTTTDTGTGTASKVTANAWNHIALVRKDNVLTLYVNGTVQVACNITKPIFFTGTEKLYIGAWGNGSYNFNGYIDEIRITKGSARFTGTFTPPTYAYTSIIDPPEIKFALTKDLSTYYGFDESLVTVETETITRDVKAATFNGSTYATFPSSLIGGKNKFSIEAIMSTTDNTTGHCYFAVGTSMSSTTAKAVYVLTRSGGLALTSSLGGTVQNLNTGKSVADGRKHSVAIVCDGEYIYLYLDGELLGKVPSLNDVLATQPIYLSSGNGSTTSTIKVYEFRVFNGVRPSIYLGKDINKYAENLVGWYPARSVTGVQWYDLSDNGVTGTAPSSLVISTETETIETTTETSGFFELDTPLTANVVLKDGISSDGLKEISETQWNIFYNGVGGDKGFGIAFAISQSTKAQIANIDNIALYVDMKGSWGKAIHGTDYIYSYPNNTLLRVKLLTDGNYKINYVKEIDS